MFEPLKPLTPGPTWLTSTLSPTRSTSVASAASASGTIQAMATPAATIGMTSRSAVSMAVRVTSSTSVTCRVASQPTPRVPKNLAQAWPMSGMATA